MRTKRCLWLPVVASVALLAGGACEGVAQARRGPRADVAPSSKEIVRILLSLRDVPLSVHGTCASAGTGGSDADLGDFVSGWMSELKQGPGANWIETDAKPESMEGRREAGWRCIVMFRHVDGDDRWGWGVSFWMSASDRRPLKESIRCLGAG